MKIRTKFLRLGQVVFILYYIAYCWPEYAIYSSLIVTDWFSIPFWIFFIMNVRIKFFLLDQKVSIMNFTRHSAYIAYKSFCYYWYIFQSHF